MGESLNEESPDLTMQDRLAEAALQLRQAGADPGQAQRSVNEKREALRDLLAGQAGSTVLMWAIATQRGFKRVADNTWMYAPIGLGDRPGTTVTGEFTICTVTDTDVEISEPGNEGWVRMKVPFEGFLPASAEEITAVVSDAQTTPVSDTLPTV
jgi:hypothetical protein